MNFIPIIIKKIIDIIPYLMLCLETSIIIIFKKYLVKLFKLLNQHDFFPETVRSSRPEKSVELKTLFMERKYEMQTDRRRELSTVIHRISRRELRIWRT